MLLVGWILRPGTINPWFDVNCTSFIAKTSGTEADMEGAVSEMVNPTAYCAFGPWTL